MQPEAVSVRLQALGCEVHARSNHANAAAGGEAETGTDLTVVDVPTEQWVAAFRVAGEEGFDFLDMIAGVDDPPDHVRVVGHVADLDARPPRRLLLQTSLRRTDGVLDSLAPTRPAAAWHEREAAEMLGIRFAGHPDPRPLLLSAMADDVTAPLRKDFVLPERSRSWPGAVEVDDPARARRRRRPPTPPGAPEGDR